jgi:hypothetical protein
MNTVTPWITRLLMAKSAPPLEARISRVAMLSCQGIIARLSDLYRPELYYMRGPGPKWRQKHGLSVDQSAETRSNNPMESKSDDVSRYQPAPSGTRNDN